MAKIKIVDAPTEDRPIRIKKISNGYIISKRKTGKGEFGEIETYVKEL